MEKAVLGSGSRIVESHPLRRQEEDAEDNRAGDQLV
jgi:hypothetical protein